MSSLSFIRILVGGRIISKIDDAKFVEGDEAKYFGFAKFYDERIRPMAIEAEKTRVEYLRRFMFRSRVSAVVLILVGIAAFKLGSQAFIGPDATELIIKGYIGLGAMLFSWAGFAIFSYHQKVKSGLFSEVFKFLGEFDYVPEGRDEMERYKKFCIVPGHTSSKTEDLVCGKYKDVSLRFEEMDLVRKSGKHRKTVFKGAVILFSFNKKFNGQTIVKRDIGKIGNFFSGKSNSTLRSLERVSLEDPEFEEMFEVYSNDQVEARYLLTTSFMERLKKLLEFFQSKKIEASFCENELFLMFNGSSDLFEPGSIFKEINLVSECRTVIEQMNLIFDVVNVLKLDQKTGL